MKTGACTRHSHEGVSERLTKRRATALRARPFAENEGSSDCNESATGAAKAPVVILGGFAVDDFQKPFKPSEVDPALVGSAAKGREALHKTLRAMLKQQRETNMLLRQILSALEPDSQEVARAGFPRNDVT